MSSLEHPFSFFLRIHLMSSASSILPSRSIKLVIFLLLINPSRAIFNGLFFDFTLVDDIFDFFPAGSTVELQSQIPGLVRF